MTPFDAVKEAMRKCGGEGSVLSDDRVLAILARAAIDALAGLPSRSLSLSEAREEIERLREAFAASNDDICQTLGKALGYPWFKDDQKNFPGATEANGVCVGDHVAESIAAEAANRFDALKADMAVVLRAELDRLEAAAPLNARETARYLMVERRLSALENSPAGLADATSNPPLSSLSSLRKGAEVAVKPLEWDTDPLGNMLAIAACGWATVEARSDGRWRWSLGGVAAGTERRKEDALKMVTNSYETRIRSALVSGSREDGDDA